MRQRIAAAIGGRLHAIFAWGSCWVAIPTYLGHGISLEQQRFFELRRTLGAFVRTYRDLGRLSRCIAGPITRRIAHGHC